MLLSVHAIWAAAPQRREPGKLMRKRTAILGASSHASAALDRNRGGMHGRAVHVVEFPMIDGEVIYRATIRAAPR
ncbi:MAG: hypothetical protein QOD10_2843 [Mycobacterium sp.]|jgi:hypothetical protein|nr:hypothetical protein [Mycobacterium sp.]